MALLLLSFSVNNNCRCWRGLLTATDTILILQLAGSFDMQRYCWVTFDRFINYDCCCFCYCHLFWLLTPIIMFVPSKSGQIRRRKRERQAQRLCVSVFIFITRSGKWATGYFCGGSNGAGDGDSNGGGGNHCAHVFYSFKKGWKYQICAQDLLTISSHSQLAWHFHIWPKKKRTHR